MLSKGDRLELFITYLEKSCCSGQCLLWAQTDMDAYDKLETLVSTRGVGKPGANFVDTKSISQGDIILAQYDSDTYLYRAQVSQQLRRFTFIHFRHLYSGVILRPPCISPGSVLVLSAKPLLTKHSTETLCKHTIRICRGMSRTVYK